MPHSKLRIVFNRQEQHAAQACFAEASACLQHLPAHNCFLPLGLMPCPRPLHICDQSSMAFVGSLFACLFIVYVLVPLGVSSAGCQPGTVIFGLTQTSMMDVLACVNKRYALGLVENLFLMLVCPACHCVQEKLQSLFARHWQWQEDGSMRLIASST